jgi:hypothetical protein
MIVPIFYSRIYKEYYWSYRMNKLLVGLVAMATAFEIYEITKLGSPQDSTTIETTD